MRVREDAADRAIKGSGGDYAEYAAELDEEFRLWLQDYADRRGIKRQDIGKPPVNERGGSMHITE